MAEQRSDQFTEEEEEILKQAQECLDAGLELKRWWERTDAEDGYEGRFELSRTYNRPDFSFGFFGNGPILGSTAPVMGNVQEMFFDQPKPLGGDGELAAETFREQIRTFALRYFLRVSDFRQPESFPEADDGARAPGFLQPFSLCPQERKGQTGFGFSQVFYKRKGESKVRRFHEEERFALTPLAEIGEKYQWIILKVNIFGFGFSFPLQTESARFLLPLPESSYLILNGDFVLDETGTREDELGRYGVGYAFLRSPGTELLGYGPGRFKAAFQVIHFLVRKSGEVHVRMAFAANRPEKITDVPLNPVDLGLETAELLGASSVASFLRPLRNLLGPIPRGSFDAVSGFLNTSNFLTGGLPASTLCLTKKQLEKIFLVQHFAQHYNVIAGALPTWRQITDWTVSEDQLPEWIRTGKSS